MKSIGGADKKAMSYLGLFFVVFVWGMAPLFTLELYKYYSPTARLAFSELVLLLTYLVISIKHLKSFNLSYIKVAIPTAFFMAIANMSQKIGLMYTTPAKYAFLENLSCISVPLTMYILVKKVPGKSTILSCFVCLASVFVLNTDSADSFYSWGIGEILCAIAGIFYGFNIAGTAVYAKGLYPPMYLAAQSVVSLVVYSVSAIIFNNVSLDSTCKLIEPIMFSVKLEHIMFVVALALISSALCWIIRTNAIKYVDATAVSIIMPFSAVVTSVMSIIFGNDSLSVNVVLGGVLGMLAIFLSTYTDIIRRRKQLVCKDSLALRIRKRFLYRGRK